MKGEDMAWDRLDEKKSDVKEKNVCKVEIKGISPEMEDVTVMDRSLGHPHSMGQGAFLASTTANVPIF